MILSSQNRVGLWENNIFRISLGVSLLFHFVFLLHLSYANRHNLHKNLNKVEVVYFHEFPRIDPPAPQALMTIQEVYQPPVKSTKVLTEQKENTHTVVKDLNTLKDDFLVHEKQQPEFMEVAEKRKVTVPALKSEDIKSPMYMNYYQVVRSRIEKQARLHYTRLDIGEVYLTFMVSSDGRLQQLKLIEERTKASDYIKQISFKSVEEADPFPPFPQDLKFPELSFNVVIYFEKEE